MKQQLIVMITFFLLSSSGAYAQKLEGIWFSEDESRTYKIESENGIYKAWLIASDRKNEKPGTLILKDLKYRNNKKRFEGIILAVSDGMEVPVTLTYDAANINLRLKRLLVDHVNIKWHKRSQGV
jgi:hypothetical protein